MFNLIIQSEFNSGKRGTNKSLEGITKLEKDLEHVNEIAKKSIGKFSLSILLLFLNALYQQTI